MQIAEIRGSTISVRRACQFVLLGIFTLIAQRGALAQVSFYTAVDLALRNSTPVRIGAAQVQHAEAAVMESVDAYKPSFSVGSSLGYSYGFPVGQPSVYSVSANSLAFSFSQPDYIRSARAALLAAQLQLKDTRQQVIMDTALDYIQLTTVGEEITALDQETGFVLRLVEIETDRVNAGHRQQSRIDEGAPDRRPDCAQAAPSCGPGRCAARPARPLDRSQCARHGLRTANHSECAGDFAGGL